MRISRIFSVIGLLWLNITSGQSNLAKGRIAAAHGQFSRIRQVASVDPRPHIICASLDQSKSTFQTAYRSVQLFLHRSRQRVPILYNGTPLFPSKLPIPFAWGSGRLSNTWFLGPTRVHIPNDISISSAVFTWLTIAADRPTVTPRYSVCNNRPHTCVVMRCVVIIILIMYTAVFQVLLISKAVD